MRTHTHAHCRGLHPCVTLYDSVCPQDKTAAERLRFYCGDGYRPIVNSKLHMDSGNVATVLYGVGSDPVSKPKHRNIQQQVCVRLCVCAGVHERVCVCAGVHDW